MAGTVMRRRCYWCGAPGRKKEMMCIKDGPVIWHFCDVECACKWARKRLEPEWREYLRLPPAERPISQPTGTNAPDPGVPEQK